MLAALGLLRGIYRFTTAFLDLIKPDYESFRAVHLQPGDPTIISWDIRFESKTHDLRSFGVIQWCEIRFLHGVLKPLLQFTHVGHLEF